MRPLVPISTSILRAVCSSLLLLVALASPAQQRKKMAVQEVDTVPFYRSIAVSVDAVGLGQLVLSSYGQIEGAVKVNLKDKYFPVIELGYGKCDNEDGTTLLRYKTSAPYGRIGCDFNVMKNKHDIYRVFAGFRYAFTSFKYDIASPGMDDPVWGGHADFNVEGVKGTYHWAEAVVGINATIFRPLHLGWSLRYRRRLAHSEGEVGNPWYVPGFGRQGNSRLGGTFNISLEF